MTNQEYRDSVNAAEYDAAAEAIKQIRAMEFEWTPEERQRIASQLEAQGLSFTDFINNR